jgi:hypothetical protein
MVKLFYGGQPALCAAYGFEMSPVLAIIALNMLIFLYNYRDKTRLECPLCRPLWLIPV